MSPGGSRGSARGKNYVLPLAIILVVGQIAAFVAIKLTKDKSNKPTVADNSLAQAPVQGSAGLVPDVTAPTPPPTTDPATNPTAPTTTTTTTTDPTATTPPTTDPSTTTTPTTDTAGGGTATPPDTDEPVVPVDPKQAKKDAAKAKAAKDKAEKLAKDKEEKAAKAEKERKDAEDRQKAAEAKRASDAEKARLAAETEKARLAAEKAKADAAAEEARLEAEKVKAEAAAKAAAAAQAAASSGSGSGASTGSSKVLVLVFGPGVSSASREAIRNVYLGKTSVWPNGTTAHPMNRPAGSAAGRKFFGGILGMSIGEYREHWSQLQLSGGGIAPSTVSSASTMLAKVAATKGGMGYVLESELPENTTGVTLVRLK